jgi:MSHA biogenesis protein MshL
MMLVLGMSACAHQSKITPSNGHIDGQNTAEHQSVAQAGANNVSDGKSVTANIPKPVTNNIYLPPPKPTAKAQVYSIVVYDTPVKEVLFAIARDSKLNIDIHPSIQGNVTLNAVDQTLPAILERLSKQVNLTYKIQNNVLTIAPDSPVLRIYQINYVNMQRTTKGELVLRMKLPLVLAHRSLPAQIQAPLDQIHLQHRLSLNLKIIFGTL